MIENGEGDPNQADGLVTPDKPTEIPSEHPAVDHLSLSEGDENQQRLVINHRIQSLLHQGITYDAIIDLLDIHADHSQFISISPPKKRGTSAGPVTTFTADKFINHLLHNLSAHELIDHRATRVDLVILPPDEGQTPQTGDGSGGLKRQTVPRTLYLAELLSGELHYDFDIIVGSVGKNTVRQQAYFAFRIPDKGQLVLVCNEPGNATFVVHGVSEDNIKTALTATKIQLGARFSTDSIFHTDNPAEWKQRMQEALTRVELPPLRTLTEVSSLEPPADWETINQLSVRLRFLPDTLTNWIEEYRVEHPEWVKMHQIRQTTGKKGTTRVKFIAPDLVQIILREKIEPIKSLGEPPSGWVSVSDYIKKNSADGPIHPSSAKQLFHQVTKLHPDWLRQCISREARQGFRPGFYYAPKAVAAVDLLRKKDPSPSEQAEIADILGEKLPPDGWITFYELSLQTYPNYDALKRLIVDVSTDLPDAQKDFLNIKTRRRALFVSPELAQRVRDRIARNVD